jgi:hypothetical protein
MEWGRRGSGVRDREGVRERAGGRFEKDVSEREGS